MTTKITDVISSSENPIFKSIEAGEAFNKAIKKGKTQVALIHARITDSKGNKLWKFLGTNSSLIGGTQNIVLNTYANVQSSDITNITNIDSESFLSLSNTVSYKSDKRVIFGFAVAFDGGSVGQTFAVKRHTKGYETNKMIAFQSITRSLDNTEENYAKYALRSNANTPAGPEVQYFVKLISPKVSNITLDGSKLPNDPTNNYNGNAEVMTKVEFDIKITPEELVSWWASKNDGDMNGYMNSIMLIAGRPATVTENGVQYATYRDCICTNKANFENKSIKNTKVDSFSYELYYV